MAKAQKKYFVVKNFINSECKKNKQHELEGWKKGDVYTGSQIEECLSAGVIAEERDEEEAQPEVVTVSDPGEKMAPKGTPEDEEEESDDDEDADGEEEPEAPKRGKARRK